MRSESKTAPKKVTSVRLLASRPNQAKGVGKRKTAIQKKATYIGWALFRENGGELLAELALSGEERSVGTGPGNLQMRLRPAANYPTKAASVPPENILRFQTFKEKYHQVRSLIALGESFIFLTKGQTRVLADRHPSYETDMIEASKKRLKSNAREAELRSMKNIILLLAKALGQEWQKTKCLMAKLNESTDSISTLSASKVESPELSTADIETINILVKEFGDNLGKVLKQFMFHRGVITEVARRTAATANDPEGYRED